MSSWGWGTKFQNYTRYVTFLFLGLKVHMFKGGLLKIILAPFFLFKNHTRYNPYPTLSLPGPATQHLNTEREARVTLVGVTGKRVTLMNFRYYYAKILWLKYFRMISCFSRFNPKTPSTNSSHYCCVFLPFLPWFENCNARNFCWEWHCIR